MNIEVFILTTGGHLVSFGETEDNFVFDLKLDFYPYLQGPSSKYCTTKRICKKRENEKNQPSVLLLIIERGNLILGRSDEFFYL